jgi:hypothetical protein
MTRQPYVYKWTHLPTLKWYVGSRVAKNCHPDDGYICSSKKVKKLIAANSSEWKREIVHIGEDAYDVETEILELFDARHDLRSFNGHNNDFDTSSYDSAIKNWAKPGYAEKQKAGLKAYAKSEAGAKELSDRAKKMWGDPEFRKAQTKARIKRYTTPEMTGFYKGPVYATNIMTGEVTMFKGNAAMKAAGFQASAISLCVNGKKKQYKGHTWSRKK